MTMNATSLYVSTCRLIILADAADKSSWTDLFRLVPYLRQSLSCTVCGNLLKEPYTPTNSSCQHHVCKNCKGGRKKLKPSCGWCKDYDKYAENLQLRILLQCYKKLCEYFMDTDVYKILLEEDEIAAGVNGGTVASSGLIDLIQEGAGFSDDYKSTAGLSKSAYSILPCVYTNSAGTQTQTASSSNNSEARSSKGSPNSRSTSNGSPMYSVMYAGSGNKITIKRKAMDETDSPPADSPTNKESKSNQLGFKKPSNRSRSSASSKRKGCRCGNATATPGKLTCCGQRCPCYVESKPCTECKCKGCRNPHRPDGMKVRPHIPQLENLQLTLNSDDTSQSCSGSLDSMDGDTLSMEAMEESLNYSSDLKSSNIKVYTSQLQEVSPSLPAAIMMDEDLPGEEDDELSSPQDYAIASPHDYNDMQDTNDMPDSNDMQDTNDMPDPNDMSDTNDMQDTNNIQYSIDMQDTNDMHDHNVTQDTNDMQDSNDIQDIADVQDSNDVQDIKDVQDPNYPDSSQQDINDLQEPKYVQAINDMHNTNHMQNSSDMHDQDSQQSLGNDANSDVEVDV